MSRRPPCDHSRAKLSVLRASSGHFRDPRGIHMIKWTEESSTSCQKPSKSYYNGTLTIKRLRRAPWGHLAENRGQQSISNSLVRPFWRISSYWKALKSHREPRELPKVHKKLRNQVKHPRVLIESKIDLLQIKKNIQKLYNLRFLNCYWGERGLHIM